jgi:hypothetical protein
MGQAEAGLEALREARRIVEPLRAAPFISRIDAFIAGGSTPVIGR